LWPLHTAQPSSQGLGTCIYARSKVHIQRCHTLRKQFLDKDHREPYNAVPDYFNGSSQSRDLEAKAAVNAMELASCGNTA